MNLIEHLREDLPTKDPLFETLVPLLLTPTGISSAGYPYLEQAAWEQFRDTVPHLFASGARLLDLIEVLRAKLQSLEASAERDNALAVCRVVRQVVRTAAITSPTDLWLMRQVLANFSTLGLSRRLLDGEAIYPRSCREYGDSNGRLLDPDQLEADMLFLLARGVVEQYDEGFRIAGHPRVRALVEQLGALPENLPSTTTSWWRALFAGEPLAPKQLGTLSWLGFSCPAPREDVEQNHWIATPSEVETGFRLVPLVLGLRAVNATDDFGEGMILSPERLSERYPGCAMGALRILRAAGWVKSVEGGEEITALGGRGFARGPGPFGIIETYHTYMSQGVDILRRGRGDVWVSRGENVGASQDANRKTFREANDNLDQFCKATGFSYGVFIEHAIGRGEATRQRFVRSGEERIRYVGADLEDAAIDSAIAEREAGRLPQNMVFVREADIGKPELLLDALRAEGLETEGAVMMVGNGFHEVRGQTDELMVDVFRGYHEAGVLLLFTEENALSVDDLRATAWNTYHAGFKYVHEKSGQGLRPAEPRPPVKLGAPLRAAWSECASQAGYVRATGYCGRTRTVYPYTPRSGFNPSISVNHFFIPRQLADKLGLTE